MYNGTVPNIAAAGVAAINANKKVHKWSKQYSSI